MRCFRDLASVRSFTEQGGTRRAAAVGFFDGLHLGHQSLLAELCQWAAQAGVEPAVVTFDRHPQEVLTGQGPARILSLEHRLLLIGRQGVRCVLVLPFDLELARWSAAAFLETILHDALGARHLLLGFDTAFGRGREGTFAFAAERGPALGIEVRQAAPLRLGGQRVSSTLVREAILGGDLDRAAALLGRAYSIAGVVGRGAARGRQLGFPTANLPVDGLALPPAGVYFARVSRLGASLEAALGAADAPRAPEAHGALVNLGVRPTFEDPASSRPALEAYLVDWQGDLYGEVVEVDLLRRHRGEMRFERPELLVRQIEDDLRAFRRWAAVP